MDQKTYSLEYDGKRYADFTFAELQGAGVPSATIGAAIKADAAARVTDFAETCRRKLASASAGKLAEYRVKEEIARDPAAASAAELDLIDREATARNIDRATLLSQISAKAAVYRELALLVGAFEAEVSAAIDAIPDDVNDIVAQISTTLTAARSGAEQALIDAQNRLAA